MFIGEPAPSQADLHFRLLGFPVRVHPLFWVVSLLLGMGGFRGGAAEPGKVLIWVAVSFVSILIHELGHAFLQRFYGGKPWITLYSFGGLASCNDCDRSPRSQIAILLAGPGAGFVFAAIIVLAMRLSGHYLSFGLRSTPVDFQGLGLDVVIRQPMGPFDAIFEPFASDRMNDLIGDLLQINILWGLVNLLPIYPLDGGQIARELFTLSNPRQGIVQSLQLSIGAAVLMVIYGVVVSRSLFLGLMFGMLAYGSYQALQAYHNHWR
jgi:stage IV sporulation protein FB